MNSKINLEWNCNMYPACWYPLCCRRIV